MNIPGYRIERELGYGGMATVYLAVQESLGRHVALKVMVAALAADRTFSERFIREARTVAQLNHPNIVAIHDVGVVEFHHYLSLEYISGGDLKQRIKQGSLTPDLALSITRQIASGLGYAHDKGYVHRDVKPENILFRDDGTAVLTDFGIAKSGEGTRMTGTGMSIGTPHYMSPEQARGKSVDGRSDLYALGVVLYEMLSGEVPYEAEDSLAVGIMHVSEPVPELPNALIQYQPLIDNLMAKDPDIRYQHAGELTAVIDEVLQGRQLSRPDHAMEQIIPQPTGTQQAELAPVKASSSGSGWKWGIGGALLAAALFMGISQYQDSQPVIMGGGGMIGGSLHSAEIPSEPKIKSPPEAQQLSLADAGTVPNGSDTIADAVTKPEDATPPPPVVKKYPLTIEAMPSDARIRILNIKPRYHPGIELVSGKYTIDISKAGYETFRGSVKLTPQQTTFTAKLKKAPQQTISSFSAKGVAPKFIYDFSESSRIDENVWELVGDPSVVDGRLRLENHDAWNNYLISKKIFSSSVKWAECSVVPHKQSWQSYPFVFVTPIGSIGYYNYGAVWQFAWRPKGASKDKYKYIHIPSGKGGAPIFLSGHKYTVAIRQKGGVLSFLINGLVVYSISSYSLPYREGKIKLMSSDGIAEFINVFAK